MQLKFAIGLKKSGRWVGGWMDGWEQNSVYGLLTAINKLRIVSGKIKHYPVSVFFPNVDHLLYDFFYFISLFIIQW